MKALNERLSKPDSTPSWPSLDDEGPASPSAPLSPSSPHPPSQAPAAAKLPIPEFKDGAKQVKSPQENV